MTAFTISALLIQHGEWWSAQCLEHDIVAQAKSLSELHRELQRVLSAHIALSEEAGVRPFENLGPAPAKYWKMWDAADLRVETANLTVS